MTTERVLKQIEEIKKLALDLGINSTEDKINKSRIIAICIDIEIEHKIEERLRNVETSL